MASQMGVVTASLTHPRLYEDGAVGDYAYDILLRHSSCEEKRWKARRFCPIQKQAIWMVPLPPAATQCFAGEQPLGGFGDLPLGDGRDEPVTI